MAEFAAAEWPIQFVDLEAQRRRLGDGLDRAISRVLEHGKFVMGPEVAALEERLEEFSGARHAITCASGTDALVLCLMAWGVGADDAVLVPAFTFAATAEAVVLAGATPVFVDVLPDTFNLDPESVRSALASLPGHGLRARAVVAVDLFGQPADYDAIGELANAEALLLLADAAQSFGAEWRGRRVGTLATATATSFFPAKPLGCYGDGGAVLTDDDELALLLRSLRVHGQGDDKYDNVRVGMNGRLDTIQAAILLQKLAIFDDELQRRAAIAARYAQELADVVAVPYVRPEATSAWAQYTILVPNRDNIAVQLAKEGVPTAVYYPRTLDRQPAYERYPVAPSGLPAASRLGEMVLALPMHPYLEEPVQERICRAVRRAVKR